VTLPSQRLTKLGLSLPPVPTPVAAYVPAVRVGDLIYSAGQLPTVDGRLIATGKVGAELGVEEAASCARVAALNAVAAVAAEAGGVDAVLQVIKVLVFVSSEPHFTGQPQVGNGASQLLGEIFGDSGRHARSAVGVAVLPLDAPVEVELIVRAEPVLRVQPVAM
jgi:enamine deaminase RidA (YjgF/YER057c/UK114 family)